LNEKDIYYNDSQDKRYQISAYFEEFKASNFMSKRSLISHQKYKDGESGYNNNHSPAKNSRFKRRIAKKSSSGFLFPSETGIDYCKKTSIPSFDKF